MYTGLDSLKTASKKVIHEAGEFLGNKVADAVANSYHSKAKPVIHKDVRNVEEIIIPPEKEILNELR